MAQNQRMSVQVQDGKLRADPSFLGKIIGSVAYGDSVTVVRQQDPWFFISLKQGSSAAGFTTLLWQKKKSFFAREMPMFRKPPVSGKLPWQEKASTPRSKTNIRNATPIWTLK